MTEIIKLGWRNLFRNPRRTAASLVTVAFGASGILIYQGFNQGIMNSYRDNTIRVRYGHGQVFPPGYRTKVLEKPWEAWMDNREEIEAKLKSVEGIVEVYPRVTFYSFLTRAGINLTGRGEGVLYERESKFFTALNFESGKDLESQDDIILGSGLATSLNAKVGDTITVLGQTIHGQLNGVDLKLSGIFHTGGQEFDNQAFRVSLATAQSLLDTPKVETFVLQATGLDAWPQVEKGVNRVLPSLEVLPFHELDKVWYGNAVNFLDSQFVFIRSIILVIVALGIFNTIAVGLLERAPELGALRANGESRSRIGRILLFENALLGFVGGLFGIVVAVILQKTAFAHGIHLPPGPGITRQFITFIEIEPRHFAQALVLPMTVTILASLWPILRLLKRTIPDLLKAS